MLYFPSFYLTFFKYGKKYAKSTHFKELLFPFFKIFYTLIVHYVINFVFSIGKQPYRDVINFVSYTRVVFSYNDKLHIFIYAYKLSSSFS